VIEEAGCGLTFKSGDAADLALALRRILRDPDKDQKGKNGKKAVEEKYNWGIDRKTLLDTVEKVGAARA